MARACGAPRRTNLRERRAHFAHHAKFVPARRGSTRAAQRAAMDDAAVPHTVAGDVQWAVGAARSSTPASAGSASAAPAQSPAGSSTNDEHLAAAWGYPALPKGVLSYKDADVALLHHAKKLFEEQLQQLQEEERQLRAGIVPSADAPLVEQPTEPHTPAPSAGLARGAPSSSAYLRRRRTSGWRTPPTPPPRPRITTTTPPTLATRSTHSWRRRSGSARRRRAAHRRRRRRPPRAPARCRRRCSATSATVRCCSRALSTLDNFS